MESSMETPQKIKNRINTWSSDSTSGYSSKENKNSNLKRYMHPMFITVLFTIAKIWKQFRCLSTNEWIKNMWYICIHTNGILFNHKRWSLAICNMDGPKSIMLSTINQTEQDKYCMTSPMCKNEQNKDKTCLPHPDPPSHLPLHPLPPGPPRAPGPSACLMHPTWAGDLFHYKFKKNK